MRAPSLSRRLLAFLALAFALVLVVAVWLFERTAAFPAEAERLGASLGQTLELSQRIHEAIHRQNALLQEEIEQLDPAFHEGFTAVNFEVGELQTRYLRLDLDTSERLAVERIKAAQAELGVKGMEIYAHLRAGRRDRAFAVMSEIEQLTALIDADFQEVQRHQLDKLKGVLGGLRKALLAGRLSLLVLTTAVAVALAAVALFLRRRVFGPLSSLLAAQDRVRDGDFSARAPAGGRDEIGRLGEGFNFMAASLAESYAVLERKVEERTRQVEALQEQVVQAAKMSALGRLVSGVAHELNNPLTVVVGCGEMLRGEVAGDPGQAELVADLLQQAERCRQIVRGLAQFARPQEAQRTAVRLNRLVDGVLALRRYELLTRNVEVERAYDPGDPELAADAGKLQQLVLNLLNNAYDAIEDAGGSGTVWLSTERRGESVVLEVRDSGTGLREPQRVFEPFYTTKEVGKGIGMGLAVCYGIVQEHGGTIEAANWGRGARFTVTLPVGDLAALAPLSAPAPEPAAAPPPRQEEALLVEDEEPVRRLQTTFLTRLGLKVSTATSGAEAIALLEQQDVDLVISDLRMPGPVGGLELYGWVSSHRPHLARRFLFVTGDPTASGDDDTTLPSHVPCVLKPFNLQTYSAAVRRLLEAGSEEAA